MMAFTFSLIVQQANHPSAFRFADTLLTVTQHKILGVFFQFDGINIACKRDLLSHTKLQTDWINLHQLYQIPLMLCQGSVSLREIENHCIHYAFECVSFGQWIETCSNADRNIVFGVGPSC